MRRKIRSGLVGMLAAIPLFVLFFFAPAARAAERFCVVTEMLPILGRIGGTYTVEDDYLYGEDVSGIVVYGNHIEVEPLEGDARGGDWAELLDPDGGGVLGFVEKKGLLPMPAYEPLSADRYLVRVDAPDLRLLPGAGGGAYRLSKWNFALIRGEIVTAYGSIAEEGEKWLLLGFSTSIEDEGDGGVGMRYAWARAEDLVSLADYVPNYGENENAWVPGRMRPFADISKDGWVDASGAVSEALRSRLLKNGFGISREPAILEYISIDDMANLYDTTGVYTADFITADLFLHAHHLIFSRMLQSLEKECFSPRLAEAMTGALAALEGASLSGGLANARATVRDMLTVPLVLLEAMDESRLSERARVEVGRIRKAEGRELSAITGAREDYTQYRPRGHYAGDPELERYFRAMSFMGNAGVSLFNGDGTPNLPGVAIASLAVLALDAAGDAWAGFDAPIDYLIGTPDDGSFSLYRGAVCKQVDTLERADLLTDEKILTAIAEEVRRAFAGPRIRDRETGNISKEEEEETRTPEFRLSGKRFTFDAYAMNQLTSPRVGDNDLPRNLPEGTDVMAILGSAEADRFAAQGDEVEGYRAALERLKSEEDLFLFGSEDTAYVRWLRVLQAGFKDSGSKQVFYRSGPWQWKKLATASASWAELKHDTVLYTKQGGAEMGGGGEWFAGKFAPPAPHGYVEPEPQVFAAIVSALDRLAAFFKEFALEEEDGEPGEYTRKIADFRALCVTAQRIAEREVLDRGLTPEDYADIKSLAHAFTSRLLLPHGTDVSYEDWEKLRMAVITDVATDFMGEAALHVGTGAPRAVYVYVNDRSGGARIAKGWVYSYYEFAHPLSEGRMTDQEWREIVYDEARGEELEQLHPEWYGELD